METVVATSILFLLAGYDTTANALSFAFYLLAKHSECQEKLRKELKKIQDSDGEISYQNLMDGWSQSLFEYKRAIHSGS